MLGIFYMGWVMVSHIGARIKDFNHYVNRRVDTQTNTYVDVYGHRRDEATGQQRTLVIENNGDIVLLDKKHRVVRNISNEERFQKWNKRREDPTRDTYMETALATKELRTTHPISPVTGETMFVKGRIYLDYESGDSYYQVSITVNKEYNNNVDAPKLFYVKVDNPFDLVRISDWQKQSEQLLKNNGHHNWLDNPEEEAAFIKDYNQRPYRASNIRTRTKNRFVNTR